MGSGLDVKIFLLLQAAGVEQGVASSGWVLFTTTCAIPFG